MHKGPPWNLPFRSEEELEDALARPTEAVIDSLSRLEGDLLVLGASGKMGPTLAWMARRAWDAAGIRHRVYGAARFASGSARWLATRGIEPVSCDLLCDADLARLPDAAAVVVMLGRKFGSSLDAPATWATNVWLPARVCQRFHASRMAVFSTGNVYGLAPVAEGGSREEDPLAPVGEYAMSALGRERIYEYFSRRWNIPVSMIRLNYACDLRYGVLHDLAKKVIHSEPIGLGMGYFNTIWQGDANAWALLTLARAASPPWIVNVTGREVLRVREVSQILGRVAGRDPHFLGEESSTALLANPARALAEFGPPRVTAEELIVWQAQWLASGGRTLDKPTHFESRDGRF